MDIYVLTSVNQDLLSDQDNYEIAEDMLSSGAPFLTFEQAKLDAQSFVEDLWQVDDYPAITLEWVAIGEVTWTAECEELGLQFMIRKFGL